MQVRKNKLLRFERRKSGLRSRHGHSQHKIQSLPELRTSSRSFSDSQKRSTAWISTTKVEIKNETSKNQREKIYKSILQRDLHFKNMKSRNPSLYFVIYTSLNLEVQNNMRAFLLENHVNTWVSANTHWNRGSYPQQKQIIQWKTCFLWQF